jgi:hypothetical protein
MHSKAALMLLALVTVPCDFLQTEDLLEGGALPPWVSTQFQKFFHESSELSEWSPHKTGSICPQARRKAQGQRIDRVFHQEATAGKVKKNSTLGELLPEKKLHADGHADRYFELILAIICFFILNGEPEHLEFGLASGGVF